MWTVNGKYKHICGLWAVNGKYKHICELWAVNAEDMYKCVNLVFTYLNWVISQEGFYTSL